MTKARRYYVRTPDGRIAIGFDYIEAANVAALEYGEGAAVIDTMAQAYNPMLQTVRVEAGERKLALEPVGGWDTGRFSLERDLIEAVRKGRVEIVQAFLAKGASANARDDKGGSALHWAVARGRIEIVEALLANGADASAIDSAGNSPLAVAEKRNQTTIAEMLRRRIA